MGSEASLKSLCELVVDCPHSTPTWTDEGAIVLRSKNIRNGRLDLSEHSCTDQADYHARIKRAKPSRGDIVITREAPMGECAMIPAGLECCLGQRMVLLRPDRQRVDPRYLLYALQAPAVQWQIGAHEGTGSTVSNLRIPALEALRIRTPPLDEQRAIASILGALDDKIELNRRMSRTLDEMALAIFQSWFVNAAAAEWPEGTLGDVLDIIRVAVRPGDAHPGSPYVGLEHFDGGSTTLSRWGVAGDVISGKSGFQRGDILFGKLRPYFHNVAVAPFEGICSTDVMVLRPRAPYWFGFALGHVNSDEFIDYATARSEGTRMPRARWADVSSYAMGLPGPDLPATYERLVEPIIERRCRLAEESLALGEMRDAILPRLLSGQLRPAWADSA